MSMEIEQESQAALQESGLARQPESLPLGLAICEGLAPFMCPTVAASLQSQQAPQRVSIVLP